MRRRGSRQLRAKLTELLGGFPAERTPLRPTLLETRSFPAYRREKIVFDSRPGMSVLAYVLLPAQARTPVAAMICVPGHGRGVDDIVGIDEQGRDRTDKSGYQHDFAIQVAEAGMAAVAIEPMGFGCRRDPINARRGLGQKACEPTAGAALMVGQTLLGWRVWDIMRTIDYIATRPSSTRRASAAWGSRAAARRRCSERRSNRASRRRWSAATSTRFATASAAWRTASTTTCRGS